MKFKWTDVENKTSDEIKKAVAQETLILYPDFNKRFDIHKYARDYQIGEVIIQNSKPIAFYSQKLTGQQTWYTVTEKKFISIV